MDVVGSTGGVGSPAAPAGSDSSAMAVREGIGVRDDRRRDLGGGARMRFELGSEAGHGRFVHRA